MEVLPKPPDLNISTCPSPCADNHENLKYNNSLLTCHICNKVFATKSTLGRHLAIHNGQRPFCCCVCNKCFTQKCNLIVHFRKHSGIFPYQCHHCNKGFDRRRTYEQHQAQHHRSASFSCDVCNKSFVRYKDLQSHQSFHTNKRLHVCVSCQKGFANKANLKVHSRIHTNELPFGCSYCNKRFRQNHVLRRHILVHTGERPYNCTTCHKRFSSRSMLKNHLLVHLCQFVCPTCNAKFADSSTLNKHQLLHSGIYPFVCNVCNKGFISNHLLQKHQIVHSNNRQFSCNICQKRFKYKGNLAVHKLVHSASACFVCETCGKDFVHKNNFKRHLRIHSGERPFACNKCDACFTVKHSLNVHYLQHTNSVPSFKCETCGACFRARSTLNYHKLKHLSMIVNDEKQKTNNVSPIMPEESRNSGQPKSQNTNEKGPIQVVIAVKLADNNQPPLISKQDAIKNWNSSDINKQTSLSDKTSYLKSSTSRKIEPANNQTVHPKQQFRKIAPKPIHFPPDAPSQTKPIVSKLNGSNLNLSSLVPLSITPKVGNAFIIHTDIRKPAVIPLGQMQYYECITCKKVFRNKRKFKQHILMHEKGRPYFCNICEQTFTANSSLKRHLQRHAGRPSYCCSICKKAFFQLGNLKVHQRKCSIKESQCHKRNNTAPSVSQDKSNEKRNCLEIPNVKHNKLKDIQISNMVGNTCNKPFKLRILLKNHNCVSTSHSDKANDKMQDCEQKSEAGKDLNVYNGVPVIKNPLPQNETTKFTKVCHICNSIFSTDKIFKRHIAAHVSKKAYKCFCKKRFKNNLSLQAHRLIHALEPDPL